MNNSGNNIKLEIEMTNRERGDSVISDIEAALDIPIQKNITLSDEEIKTINKCEKCDSIFDKYEWIIRSFTIIFGIGSVVALVYVIGYGLIQLLQLLINY
tara:strand:+ start:862 stop:1161 length:300 start_codon:yes stop_codon:yes gene_type:complete